MTAFFLQNMKKLKHSTMVKHSFHKVPLNKKIKAGNNSWTFRIKYERLEASSPNALSL